jgi:hypothetical protein
VPTSPQHAPPAEAATLESRRREERVRTLLELALRAAYLGVFAALPAWLVLDAALAGYRRGSVPFDLGVFLRASHEVASGRSPYPAPEALRGDTSYVYPPLLAFLVWPFSVLSAGPAVLLWTLFSAACLVAALALLGVTDWRCYGVAFLWPPTRAAIVLGTVGPLLLLGVAVVWRYRDRLRIAAGTAAGAAITLKLLLWPLVVWLAATRRYAAAALAAVAAVVLAAVSWAAIGFAGLGDYPSLLRRLSNLESPESYSPYAAARTAALGLGLPTSLAWPAAIVAGVTLLAAAFFTVRGDRRSLTLVLAAALALSPLVWVHYLILLLVPVALARPRLTPLWLVPLAIYALRPSGWTLHSWAGARTLWLTVVLGVTALVVAEAVRVQPSRSGRTAGAGS